MNRSTKQPIDRRPPLAIARVLGVSLLLGLLVVSLSGCDEPDPYMESPEPAEVGTEADKGGFVHVPPVEPPATAAEEDSRQQLVRLMGTHGYRPSREHLLTIAPQEELVPLLVDIQADESLMMYQRQRALGSLSFFPGEQTRETLEALINDPQTPPALRRSALRAYGSAFGDEAVDLLSGMLEHDDEHTQATARQALQAMDTARARQALQEHDAREGNGVDEQ